MPSTQAVSDGTVGQDARLFPFILTANIQRCMLKSEFTQRSESINQEFTFSSAHSGLPIVHGKHPSRGGGMGTLTPNVASLVQEDNLRLSSDPFLLQTTMVYICTHLQENPTRGVDLIPELPDPCSPPCDLSG